MLFRLRLLVAWACKPAVLIILFRSSLKEKKKRFCMIAIIGLWVLFGASHSILASESVKASVRRRFGDAAQRFYRLAFTTSSLLFFAPIVFLHWREDAKYPLLWSFGSRLILARAVTLSCAVMFVISLKLYNMSDFLGLGALRSGGESKKKRDSSAALGGGDVFSITFFHRFVRHPWYFFMLGMAWSQPMNGLRLVSAVCGTVYLNIGAYLEEEKLLAHAVWGKQYAEYSAAVGCLVPLPWKILSLADAERLVREAAGSSRYSCARRAVPSPRRESDEE
jgi:protein-S-isoprenylcysteine O-methyltransferase Ste14